MDSIHRRCMQKLVSRENHNCGDVDGTARMSRPLEGDGNEKIRLGQIAWITVHDSAC